MVSRELREGVPPVRVCCPAQSNEEAILPVRSSASPITSRLPLLAAIASLQRRKYSNRSDARRARHTWRIIKSASLPGRPDREHRWLLTVPHAHISLQRTIIDKRRPVSHRCICVSPRGTAQKRTDRRHRVRERHTVVKIRDTAFVNRPLRRSPARHLPAYRAGKRRWLLSREHT